METIAKRITPTELNRALEAAIKSGIDGVNIKRGHISFYLNEHTVFPLVTLEDFKDSFTNGKGAQGLSHNPKLWKLRATIKVDQDSQPDEELNDLQSELRKALFRSKTHDFSNISLSEGNEANYTLPEPGLPYASIDITLQAAFIEPL